MYRFISAQAKKGTYLGGVNDALLYHVDILSIHGIIANF